MKHKLFCTLQLMVLAWAGFAVSPAGALPATAEPSWNADCSRLAFSTTGSGNSNGQIQTIGC